MRVYLHIQNNYTQYTHILCKHKLLFWMRLIVSQQKHMILII